MPRKLVDSLEMSDESLVELMDEVEREEEDQAATPEAANVARVASATASLQRSNAFYKKPDDNPPPAKKSRSGYSFANI